MFARSVLHDSPTDARCEVLAATALRVRAGVNAGDDLGSGTAPCAGDIYRLEAGARKTLVRLSAPGVDGMRRIGIGSGLPGTGGPVAVEARLLFMASDGGRAEVLVLRPVAAQAGRWLLPLQPLAAGLDHHLIRIDAPPGPGRLPDLALGAIGRGARILMADGTPCRVESLRPGARVLTRDHGAQPLRWIGRATLRAAGGFAPVVIGRGAMGNAGDLAVGPHHRLFLYQRDRRPGQATAEVLVQARDLVDGAAIFRREGGFVDYLFPVFDAHEVIYAEGLPTESLLVTEGTLHRLPEPLAGDLRRHLPTLAHRPHFGSDARRPGGDAAQPVAGGA